MAAIGDYAIIGDGRSAALVAKTGEIDWLCWPRFESAPIFGALLDERGGSWRLTPADPHTASRAYHTHSNVLDTTFVTSAGRVVVTDLMSIADEADKHDLMLPDHELVRCLHCEAGEVVVDMEVAPRPDFAPARAKDLGPLGIRWEVGRATLLTLRGETPIVLGDDGVARARIHLRAGERVVFALGYDAEAPAILPMLGEEALAGITRADAWWRRWAERATYQGPYREQVLRSALALKLLSFAPSGAIVAAPTTSLPERIGGGHNWDYRYCWLRDASFTVRALLDLGYVEDSEAFCGWLLHATRLTRPELRVLYDVYGKSPPIERELPLRGYRDSRPVRVGNKAFHQLQLDTYGEVIDATAQIAHATGHLDRATQALLRDYGRYICDHWREPDSGIWEPREPVRHRTHSRVCCWVAVDRLLALADQDLLRGVDRARLAHERAAIREDIEQNAYNPRLQAYASWLGGEEVDAALLQMSWFGFHPAGSPRMVSTYARIREVLNVAPGLFHRNLRSLRRDEGAFWICSFWAVEHLAEAGELDDARRLFEHACAYANDLGLMAEEVDPHTGTQLGNFPQAYTHVGLISAALALEEHAA